MTYRLLVHAPGKVVRQGGEFVTIGRETRVVGTGKSFAEATTWARRSRFRTIEEEA